MGYNKIHIISGKWRSRKIDVLNKPDLRPTTGRVREMLFNWLMHDIQAATCLDLFAGSGALGLEALSRGAKFVDFIEQNKTAHKVLQNNAATLQAANYNITNCNALKFLKRDLKKYDLIFIDAPFKSDLTQKVLDILNMAPLKSSCKIYIESAKSIENDTANMQTIKHKKTGAVFSTLLTNKKQIKT